MLIHQGERWRRDHVIGGEGFDGASQLGEWKLRSLGYRYSFVERASQGNTLED
jgi:hypothetical protein